MRWMIIGDTAMAETLTADGFDTVEAHHDLAAGYLMALLIETAKTARLQPSEVQCVVAGCEPRDRDIARTLARLSPGVVYVGGGNSPLMERDSHGVVRVEEGTTPAEIVALVGTLRGPEAVRGRPEAPAAAPPAPVEAPEPPAAAFRPEPAAPSAPPAPDLQPTLRDPGSRVEPSATPEPRPSRPEPPPNRLSGEDILLEPPKPAIPHTPAEPTKAGPFQPPQPHDPQPQTGTQTDARLETPAERPIEAPHTGNLQPADLQLAGPQPANPQPSGAQPADLQPADLQPAGLQPHDPQPQTGTQADARLETPAERPIGPPQHQPAASSAASMFPGSAGPSPPKPPVGFQKPETLSPAPLPQFQTPAAVRPGPEPGAQAPAPTPVAYSTVTDDPNFAASPWAQPPQSAPSGTVVAVVAAKGGAGKSSVSVWLTESLHNMGKRTVLVDANIGQPDIMKMLNSRADSRGLPALIAGSRRFTRDDLNNALLPCQGLGDLLLGAGSPAVMRMDSALQALTEAAKHLRTSHDYVIVDTPVASSKERVLTNCVLHAADILLVVTNPHDVTLRDTLSWLTEITWEHNRGGLEYDLSKCLGVLNKASPEHPPLSYARRAVPNLNFIAEIAYDPDATAAANSGRWQCPPAALAGIANIAEQLAGSGGQTAEKPPRKGLLGRLFGGLRRR